MKIKNLKELISTLKNSDSLVEEIKIDPINFLESVEVTAPINNKRVFLTVVYMVGAALLLSIFMAAILNMMGEEVDDIYVMVVSASIGALAGLLVPIPPE